MGKFLNPSDLKANLYRIFKEEEKEIIIIRRTNNYWMNIKIIQREFNLSLRHSC